MELCPAPMNFLLPEKLDAKWAPQPAAPQSVPPERLVTRRCMTAALALGAASLSFLGTEIAEAKDWEQIDDRDGILVYRKHVPGSPLYAFRGKGVIEAPAEKVGWVLADNAHRVEWVDRLVKSVVLEEPGPYEQVIYQHYKCPPGVSDRDFVYRAKAFSKQDGSVVLEIASEIHAGAPPTVGVRGELQMCSYVLSPAGPNKTHVDVIIMTDPKGALPDFLINLVQKSWPRNSLLAMRTHVRKDFVRRLKAPPIR